jgi:hypothetical protein
MKTSSMKYLPLLMEIATVISFLFAIAALAHFKPHSGYQHRKNKHGTPTREEVLHVFIISSADLTHGKLPVCP